MHTRRTRLSHLVTAATLAGALATTALAFSLPAAATARGGLDPHSQETPAPRPSFTAARATLTSALIGCSADAPCRADPWPVEPQQFTRWQGIDLPGATCGRGAPYRYYLSRPAEEPEGLLFLLNGGGACVKEGPAPPGVTGIARQLYCMEFSNFEDQLANDLAIQLVATRVSIVRRNDPVNPFRSFVYVFVPYCTGDVHAGAMRQPHDYDPRPDSEFLVLHRGHLNVVAVLDDVQQRFPELETAIVTGVSAGGIGAILNYPEFIARWPRAVLIPDSGIAPLHDRSLMVREGPRLGAQWGARQLLPPYCQEDRCVSDTLYLLAAHARAYDGRERPWLPFGFLQSQRDSVLSAYLEMEPCGFQMALRSEMIELPGNVRAFVPGSDEHVFLATPGYATPGGQVELSGWFARLAMAQTAAELPPNAIDAWTGCYALQLPYLARE